MLLKPKHLLLLFWLFLSMIAFTSQADQAKIFKQVKEVTLDNGMKFLLLRRDGAPVFSAYIRVRVGGIDEPEGKTGIAHLLEHMAFKGTTKIGGKDYTKEKQLLAQIELIHQKILQASGAEREKLRQQFETLKSEAGKLVSKEEFSRIYLRNGATNLNATTSQDLTSYFVTLPSNKLELWAYLESNRLKDPVFREFYSERDVVLEERRMRNEDSPFGKLYEKFMDMAFEKSPYRRPTIGYPEDINRLSATDLQKFYSKYYVPSNMVGAIVGDIDLEHTEALLKKYFGTLTKRPTPQLTIEQEPEPKAAKTKTIRFKFDAAPSFIVGYLKPNLPHPDDFRFDVLEQILCEGRTSRLYRTLVENKKLVQNLNCSASVPGSRLPNMFFIYGSIRQGHSAQEVIDNFELEIEKIKKSGVSEQELKKAKNNLKAKRYYDLQSNNDIADALSYFQSVSGSYRYLQEYPDKIDAVNAAQIKAIVGKYFNPNRRRLGVLQSNLEQKK